jgi:hypothetical protein
MAETLAQKIEREMDHFCATATDDEFFALLNDCGWEYYAENEQRFKDELAAIGLEPPNFFGGALAKERIILVRHD